MGHRRAGLDAHLDKASLSRGCWQGNLVDVEITSSARRHGIADDDIVHAVVNAVRTAFEDDYVMRIGPDRAGQLLEVGVRESDDGLVIFHAMPARDKYLR